MTDSFLVAEAQRAELAFEAGLISEEEFHQEMRDLQDWYDNEEMRDDKEWFYD